ncbi:hypothetical protein N658DRAFT_231343 [Parathielavia hyrcaniae]|uniref:Uncharacterized protein n=1 Tax=Parathielavia hyrcaniae TaxID=113614 RepID=A0AAN6Q5A3_9PEZI|nr:hypothetical protein N658DRAFT_231343 [Parathielavia hyrcaniae]
MSTARTWNQQWTSYRMVMVEPPSFPSLPYGVLRLGWSQSHHNGSRLSLVGRRTYSCRSSIRLGRTPTPSDLPQYMCHSTGRPCRVSCAAVSTSTGSWSASRQSPRTRKQTPCLTGKLSLMKSKLGRTLHKIHTASPHPVTLYPYCQCLRENVEHHSPINGLSSSRMGMADAHLMPLRPVGSEACGRQKKIKQSDLGHGFAVFHTFLLLCHHLSRSETPPLEKARSVSDVGCGCCLRH